MAEPRAYVKNAADPQQVRFAARKEREKAERYSNALAAVMATRDGRLVIGELLERSGLWRSSVDSHAAGSMVWFNEGRRNYGLELLADVQNVDEEAYLQMERERRAILKSETAEAAAHQTPPAGGQ